MNDMCCPINGFALSGRDNIMTTFPRALPWADSSLPFQGVWICGNNGPTGELMFTQIMNGHKRGDQ